MLDAAVSSGMMSWLWDTTNSERGQPDFLNLLTTRKTADFRAPPAGAAPSRARRTEINTKSLRYMDSSFGKHVKTGVSRAADVNLSDFRHLSRSREENRSEYRF